VGVERNPKVSGRQPATPPRVGGGLDEPTRIAAELCRAGAAEGDRTHGEVHGGEGILRIGRAKAQGTYTQHRGRRRGFGGTTNTHQRGEEERAGSDPGGRTRAARGGSGRRRRRAGSSGAWPAAWRWGPTGLWASNFRAGLEGEEPGPVWVVGPTAGDLYQSGRVDLDASQPQITSANFYRLFIYLLLISLVSLFAPVIKNYHVVDLFLNFSLYIYILLLVSNYRE
jgi:hypothetical protein